MALETNLIANYRMEGNSNDNSGSGFNGTDTDMSYGLSYGKITQGAHFNASTGKIDLPSLGSSITNFTMAGWVNLTSGQAAILFGTFTSGPGNAAYISYNHLTANQLTAVSFTGSDTKINGGALSTGVNHFVAFTRDSSGNGNLYIDNGAALTGTLNTNALGTDNNSMGYYRPGASTYLDGNLDEVSFWSRVLSSSEITQLYNNGIGMYFNGTAFVANAGGGFFDFF